MRQLKKRHDCQPLGHSIGGRPVAKLRFVSAGEYDWVCVPHSLVRPSWPFPPMISFFSYPFGILSHKIITKHDELPWSNLDIYLILLKNPGILYNGDYFLGG